MTNESNNTKLLKKLKEYVESKNGAWISQFPEYQKARIKFGSMTQALQLAGVLEIYQEKKKNNVKGERETNTELLEELKKFIDSSDKITVSEFPKYQKIYRRFGSMEAACNMLDLGEKKVMIANKKYEDDEISELVRNYYTRKIKEPDYVSNKRTLWIYRYKTQKNAIYASKATGMYLIAQITRILIKEQQQHKKKITENEKKLFKEIQEKINSFVEKNY